MRPCKVHLKAHILLSLTITSPFGLAGVVGRTIHSWMSDRVLKQEGKRVSLGIEVYINNTSSVFECCKIV